MVFVVRVSFFSIALLITTTFNKITYRGLIQYHPAELMWTLWPILILFAIALPSLKLLYLIDEPENTRHTAKAQGHQWYWQYDIPNLTSYDSFMIGNYRFLDVDNRLILPTLMKTRILITAADVLHSWTLPTIGAKADAVPGRVNKLTVLPQRSGVYYGQCREICGRNHSFIPIAVERN